MIAHFHLIYFNSVKWAESRKWKNPESLAGRLMRAIFTVLIVEIAMLINFSFFPPSVGKYRWLWVLAILGVYFLIDAVIGGNIRNRMRDLEAKYRRTHNWKKSVYRKRAWLYLCLHFLVFPALTWFIVTLNI